MPYRLRFSLTTFPPELIVRPQIRGNAVPFSRPGPIHQSRSEAAKAARGAPHHMPTPGSHTFPEAGARNHPPQLLVVVDETNTAPSLDCQQELWNFHRTRHLIRSMRHLCRLRGIGVAFLSTGINRFPGSGSAQRNVEKAARGQAATSSQNGQWPTIGRKSG